MRRITLAVMLLGCLTLVGALFMPTAAPPMVVKVSAQSLCQQGCDFIGDKAKNDHFAFCHVDHGGAPHVICPDSSSIDDPHLSTHEFDFCINTLDDLARCEGKK